MADSPGQVQVNQVFGNQPSQPGVGAGATQTIAPLVPWVWSPSLPVGFGAETNGTVTEDVPQVDPIVVEATIYGDADRTYAGPQHPDDGPRPLPEGGGGGNCASDGACPSGCTGTDRFTRTFQTCSERQQANASLARPPVKK